ncbi:hypothetical protein CC79DRAFT_1373075 [Sarocladium strictum]
MIPSVFMTTVFGAALAQAARELSTTTKPPVLGNPTPQGCFKSVPAGVLEKDATRNVFNSAGMCNSACRKKDKPVVLIQAQYCICSDIYPARQAQAEDNACNFPCPGYAMEACGSENGAYSVWNTGLQINVKFAPDSEDGGEEGNETGEGDSSWDTMMAIAAGLWDNSGAAAVNIMSNLCNYFDCTRRNQDTDEEKLL